MGRKNIEIISDETGLEDTVIIPSTTVTKSEEIDDNDVEVMDFDEADELALGTASLGRVNSLNGGILEDKKESDTIVDPRIDGKQYSISKVNVKGRKLSARSRLGLTTPVKVALYNSGFLYVTNEISQSAENELMLTLSEFYQKLAIRTAGFSFSSDSVNFDSDVIDFVDSLIEDGGMTTLKDIPSDETIWSYVSILELPVIYLGLIKAINPSSFRISNTCKNVLKVEDKDNRITIDNESEETDKEIITREEQNEVKKTKRIACNTTITADVFPDSLFRISEHADIARIKKLNVSATSPKDGLSDIEQYREDMGLIPEKITINVNDSDVILTISDPSIERYIRINNIVIDSITKTVDEIIISDDDNTKRLKELELFDKDGLFKYVHFISSIEYSDGVIDASDEDIIDGFSTICKFDNVRENILNAIKKYISEKSLTIVGIPEYECDRCKNKVDGVKGGEFKSIIPLNMQNFFLALYNLKST